jgi:hypothetical protein
MEGAVRSYNEFGFEEIEAYYETPLERTLSMGQKL